jgi:hypothetical protein
LGCDNKNHNKYGQELPLVGPPQLLQNPCLSLLNLIQLSVVKIFTYNYFTNNCLPEVVEATQCLGQDDLGHLFTVTRTWVYSFHRAIMKILGRWNFILMCQLNSYSNNENKEDKYF